MKNDGTFCWLGLITVGLYLGFIWCVSDEIFNCLALIIVWLCPGFTGCIIDEKFLTLAKTAEVTTVCYDGSIYAAFHDKVSFCRQSDPLFLFCLFEH